MTPTRRRRISIRLALLALALGLHLPAPSQAEGSRPRALVILDGSGSMWGEIGSTPKIETLQSGIARLIDLMEGRADLGLMGYGHRRKSDCKDVELAFPPGPIDTAGAKSWLSRFSPRGKTPIATALQTAGEALTQGGVGGHIVIITDGADNCRQDPCAVAAGLAAADKTLRMHVVVLGRTKEDMRKTLCIAERGQGLVETVTAPTELDPALDRVMAAITGTPATGDDNTATTTGLPGLRLALRLGPDGPELTDDLAWIVTRDGNQVYSGSTASPALDLPPGGYQVTVTAAGLKAEQAIEVGAEGPTTAVLDLGAGIVRLTLIAGAGAVDIADAYYAVYRADATTGAELATVAVGRGSPPPMILPAGTYRVVFEQGLARIERALAVEAGREIASDIAFDIGTLEVSALAQDGGPKVGDVYITVAEDDPEAPGGRREVATSAAGEPTFTLRAGLYHVRVERGDAVAQAEATVRGGEATVQEVVIPSGRITLASRIAGSTGQIDDLIAYRIENLDDGARTPIRLNGPTASVVLAAGRYRITSQYGTGNARAQRETVVAPGGEEAVMIEHEAGVIAFSVKDLAKPRNAQWTVKLADGAPVWASADPSPRVPLGAGDYEVEVRLGNRKLTERFNVAPGDAKTVEVRPE